MAGRFFTALSVSVVYNAITMTSLETTQTVPLTVWEDGTIRITGSRVTLDSIVHHFKLGATSEQIAHKFPSIELADIYAAITYYLNHLDEIEAYLHAQELEADVVQHRIKSDLQYRTSNAEMRERLLARWRAREDLDTAASKG